MNFFGDLNQEQKEAVQHETGPLLVLAGAGSGKTRIVTYRIAHLLSKGIPAESIVALTFTNKAAEEMQHRIQKLLQGVGKGPLIATFHSLGARILRESAHHLGYKNDFTIYDEDDANKVLKGCLLTLGIKGEASTYKSLKSLISVVKNQQMNPEEVISIDMPHDLQNGFVKIYHLYQERLKEANALDFDDLLFLVVKLFQEHKEVLEHYQKRWEFLLIDEYQDTNSSQYLLAKMISKNSKNIFVVGDPDQSIYSWRGANIHNILNFEKDFKNAKVIRLEQNYRSRENILQAANHLIQNNISRIDKKLWSSRGEGEKITLFVGETDRDEAEFVAEKIDRLNKRGKHSLRDMAIFYRTNFQSRIFEDVLLRFRIPYQIIGGLSFYERKEIKDLLSILHMIHSEQNIVAFTRSLLFLKQGIGETSLEKVRVLSREKGWSILQTLKALVEGTETIARMTEKHKVGFREYLELIVELRELNKTMSLKDLINAIINKSRFYDILREDKETFEERKANIEEMVTKAYEWEFSTEDPTLQKFLEELTLKSAVDEMEEQKDKINLMTIHNSKGLEFSYVFVVGMEEDLFPHANSRQNAHAVEEERRLCYVGMTRAKEQLFLTAAESRFIWGSHRTMRPSRFLREIPPSYIKKVMYYEAST